MGLAIGTFNTMSLVGAAYSPWFFWNGRQDSLWGQATAPLESPIEQGVSRAQAARLIAGDPSYRAAYEALFGPLPPLPSEAPATKQEEAAVTKAFVNIAKAIAAYERLLLPGETRFDRYAASLGQDAAQQPPMRSSPTRKRRGCGCSSARRNASTATTGRCSPTMSSTTPACCRPSAPCRTRAAPKVPA